MTKFEQKSFSMPANSKAYVDNWDRVFGEPVEKKCVQCGKPVEPKEPWTRAACSVECEREFYRALGDAP